MPQQKFNTVSMTPFMCVCVYSIHVKLKGCLLEAMRMTGVCEKIVSVVSVNFNRFVCVIHMLQKINRFYNNI
ncbi:hypothetical protein HanIR_Chr11g0508671 [Helianthus annuus]|nr:hypothetical protein HanIR_Chr11g0508671 [Helianthus annuus]